MSKNSRRKHEKPQGNSNGDIFIPPVKVPVSKPDDEPLSKSGASIDDFITRKKQTRSHAALRLGTMTNRTGFKLRYGIASCSGIELKRLECVGRSAA